MQKLTSFYIGCRTGQQGMTGSCLATLGVHENNSFAVWGVPLLA